MPVTTVVELTEEALEGSTYAITCAFTDETGGSVTPNAATWSLYDTEGNVINSRSNVTITPLASSVTVALKADDLPYQPDGTLVFVLRGTYDSTLGSDLPLVDQCRFVVRNVLGS